MENRPLVSIIIATYNSSKYVLETIESALEQTYRNVEIIVTDDCSTDETVVICQQYAQSHYDVGIPIKVITTEKNTGVAGNANRGFKASRGEWLKFIAGDDLLAPTAIEAYINYVNEHPDVHHLRAGAIHFSGIFDPNNLPEPDKIAQYIYQDKITAQKQFSVISKIFFGSGPTYFIRAETFKSIGCFDERFQMQEDYPLFIKMIGKGYKMMYLDHVTVYKRIVPTSLQYDKNKDDIFPKNKVRAIMDWEYKYKQEALGPVWRAFLKYSLKLQQAIVLAGNTKKSFKCRVLYRFYIITDPFLWYGHYYSYINKIYMKYHR